MISSRILFTVHGDKVQHTNGNYFIQHAIDIPCVPCVPFVCKLKTCVTSNNIIVDNQAKLNFGVVKFHGM